MIQGKKKKWSFYRRVIAYVLAAAMFVSILPAQSLVVYAADTTYAGNFDSPIDETDITNKTLERGFELKLVGKKTRC